MSVDASFLGDLIIKSSMFSPMLAAGYIALRWQRKEHQDTIADKANFGEMITGFAPNGKSTCHYHLSPDGHLSRYFTLDGLDYSPTNFKGRQKLRNSRKRFIETTGKEGVRVKIIIKKRWSDTPIPHREHGNEIVRRLDKKWSERFNDLSKKSTYIVFEVDDQDKKQKLDAVATSFLKVFKDYRPRELRHRPAHSEIFGLYCDLLNPGMSHKPAGTSEDIGNALSASDIVFNQKTGLVRIRRNLQETYGAFIVLNEWESGGDSEMIGSVLNLPYEITVLHSIKAFNRMDSQKKAKYAENMDMSRLRSSEIKNQHKKFQNHFHEGVKDARLAAEQQLHFFVHCKNKNELFEGVNDIVSLLSNRFSVISQVLTTASPQAFFNFFPGRYARYRTELVDSKQVMTLQPFAGSHAGFERCVWGDHPVQKYPSASGTGVVNVTFHQDETSKSGSWAMIGSNGAGKTTSALHMMYGATAAYPELMTLFITMRGGGYTAVKAAGGKFLSLAHNDVNRLRLNPLLRDLNNGGALHVSNWLRIVGGDGQKISPEADQAIEHVIRTLWRAQEEGRPEHAKLSQIYHSHLTGYGEFSNNLRRWVENKQYSEIFNGDEDDFVTQMRTGDSRLFAVDSLGLIDDPVAAMPVFYHLLKSFEAEAVRQGRPWMIVADECPAVLKHQFMRDNLSELIVQMRKNDGIMGLLFQNVDQVEEVNFVNMINTQFRTKFFFPSDEERSKLAQFKLSEQAIDLLLDDETPARTILMQKKAFTTAFDADLGSLGNDLEIFNSDGRATDACRALERLHGDNFVEPFLALRGRYKEFLDNATA